MFFPLQSPGFFFYLLSVTQGSKYLPSSLLCTGVLTVLGWSEKPPAVTSPAGFPSLLVYNGRLPPRLHHPFPSLCC